MDVALLALALIGAAGDGMTLYRYIWGNNEKRATLKGRMCRVVARGKMNSALVEFADNGQREVVSRNALRRLRVQ